MMSPEPFTRDPRDWLRRLSPEEWLRSSLNELRRAEDAVKARDAAALAAGVKRAAGMALNGALLAHPEEGWGRTYVEHLAAIAADDAVPAPAREAARRVLDARPPSGALLSLRSRGHDERLIDDARTVMAHAYAVVYGSAGKPRR